MKLVKLVFLLDRLSIASRGIPVVGGVYYSMRNGPVTGELLDIINAGKLADDDDSSWERFISHRSEHHVELREDPAVEYLSPAEIQMIYQLHQDHGAKDQWELRDWCHHNCGEWTPMKSGRESIQVEDIALNVGKSKEQTKRISEEANEANLMAAAFSACS